MKIRVGVIFGGESVEHEVSIISAVQAMKAMDEDKYEIIPIYISKEREWYTGGVLKSIENYRDLDSLKRYATKVVLYAKNPNTFVLQTKGLIKRIINEIDIAFPIVHGTNVEDGTLQGYLNLIGVPYVGSNIYASVVGQDKVFMKQIFESSKIPITNYVWFFDSEYIENNTDIINKISELKFPVIIKPASLGSSVGISKVHTKEDLKVAIEEAMQYDTKIVVEEVVTNLVEVNCSVLGNYEYQQVSEIEEVMSRDEFLSYADKYIGNSKNTSSKGMVSANRIIPARIDDKLKEEVRSLSKQVFKVLNTAGVCRIDFLINNETKDIYVNEINTIPGSLSFYLWEPTGKNYTTLIDELITLAIKRYKKYSKMTFSFTNNILSVGGIKGLKELKGIKTKLKR